MIERRICPVRGREVLLDTSRVRLPRAWPTPEQQPPEWAGQQPITTIGPVQVHANGRPLLILEASDPSGGLGANEVLFHADASWAQVLRAVNSRVHSLRRDARLRHFVWACDLGSARSEQPHSLLLASPSPLPATRELQLRVLPEQVRHARSEGRVLWEGEGACVLLPHAPLTPFECWVLHIDGTAPAGEDTGSLGQALARCVALLGGALAAPLALSLAVRDDGWLLVVQPRLHPPTAMELATGIAMHGVPSERAASVLRA
ncbi:MAG: hypothetical protein VX899_01090 [Myxococcota bacterium]|nr:hypothetical protein [Myxococcota bacterium]